MSEVVSIIMPAFNSGRFIKDAIESVLAQTHEAWELLVINDGSTDNTEQQVQSFGDPRIKYHYQTNGGVGSARNEGLQRMQGDYFCFLDADDLFTPNALSSRLEVFTLEEVDFVDGGVQYVDHELMPLKQSYMPTFKGQPYHELIRLSDNCFFGNTWMIRKRPDVVYRFDTSVTHNEDLLFYLSIAEGGNYSYARDTILLYRQNEGSAMTDIKGLERGYLYLLSTLKSRQTPFRDLAVLKAKLARMMGLCYLKDAKDLPNAILSPFRILFR